MKLLCYAFSTFLIFAPLSVSLLAKVPETTKIVFTSNREGNSEIYIMNPDACAHFNLQCIKVVDLIKRENWIFE